MYLIMTTYRQDIMTTFSWVHDRSTIFTYFSEHFSKIYTTQAYMSLSTEVFMLKNNNISLQYCFKKCLIFSDSDINHIKVENKITAFSLNLKAFLVEAYFFPPVK